MRFLKHMKMKDVCVEVLEHLDNNQLRIRWWNLAMGEPFMIGDRRGPAEDVITIKYPQEWTASDNPGSLKTRA